MPSRATGILVFLAAMAVLALVSLRFASERPVELDRWPAYLVVLGVGIVGYVIRLIALIAMGPLEASSGPTARPVSSSPRSD